MKLASKTRLDFWSPPLTAPIKTYFSVRIRLSHHQIQIAMKMILVLTLLEIIGSKWNEQVGCLCGLKKELNRLGTMMVY